MQIFIKIITDKTITIDIESTSSIEEMKDKIFEKTGVCKSQQRLIYKGIHLEDNQKLQDYKIERYDIIHQGLRLRGC